MNWDDFEKQLALNDLRAEAALAAAIPAFAELLHLAETRDSGQIGRIARFLTATYNGECFTFDLFDLRCVDLEISDKMLACIDCLRWATSDLYRLVPDGDARIQAVMDRWGLRPTTSK